MPELPEVSLMEQVLKKALHNPILSVEVANPRILKWNKENELSSAIEGRSLSECYRHGKYLFARIIHDGWLALHFGMSGKLFFSPPTETLPLFTCVAIHFYNHERLVYTSVRLLGFVGLVPDKDDFLKSKGIGADALSIGRTEFAEALGKYRSPIKALLLGQKVVAGVGNLYADEILFQSGVHPLTPPQALSPEAVDTIYRNMGEILRLSIELKTDFDRFPAHTMLRHRFEDRICPHCGKKFQRMVIGGRTTYYCATKQPLPDGSLPDSGLSDDKPGN